MIDARTFFAGKAVTLEDLSVEPAAPGPAPRYPKQLLQASLSHLWKAGRYQTLCQACAARVRATFQPRGEE